MLHELQHQTGMQIQVKGSLVGTLTQVFEDVPLEQGLRRLFREVNTVYFYAPYPPTDATAGRLIQVWLIPRDDSVALRSPLSAVSAEAVEPHSGPDPLVETAERPPSAGGNPYG